MAWQYCGARGKTENCQCGVFSSFTSEAGYGLLEGRLYLPKPWFSPEYQQRREDCHVPAEVAFATKIGIALELLKRQIARGIFHGQWVGCDSFFGVDRAFRDQLAAMGKIYLAAIKPKSKVWIGKRALTAAEVASEPSIGCQRLILAERAKGPIVADVAALRVWPREGSGGPWFADGRSSGASKTARSTWAWTTTRTAAGRGGIGTCCMARWRCCLCCG